MNSAATRRTLAIASLAVAAALLAAAAHTHALASGPPPAPAEITAEKCIKEATGTMTAVALSDCSAHVTMAGGTLASPGTKDLPGSFAQGTHKLVWAGTATDGKRLTKTQTLIVRDLTSPTLTITSSTPNTPEAISATAPATPLPKSVSDLVDYSDNVTPKSAMEPVRNPAGDLAVGSHTLVWTVTDGAGLSSSATQKVVVSDTTAPEITCPPDVRADRDSSIAKSVVLPHLGSATVVDAVDTGIKAPTSNFAQTNGGASTLPKTTTTVTWTAKDASDNSASCEQDIHVVPTRTEYVLPPGGVVGQKFGSALASGGAAIFVGNPEDGTRAENSGSVTAYNAKTGVAIRTLHQGAIKNLYFGTALAVFGPTNNLLAVGAPGYDGNGALDGQENTGAVFVYNVHSGVLEETIHNPNTGVISEEGLPATKPNRGDHFGASLAAMGDKLVIGAYMYDKLGVTEKGTPPTKSLVTTPDVGKVYVFDSKWTKLYEIENPAPKPNGRFGNQIAAYNSTDSETIYVSSLSGSPTPTTTSRGAVYAFDAPAAESTGATLTASIFSDTPATRTLFGETQLRTGSDGSVYIGEPDIVSASGSTGKIHHYSSTGMDLGTIKAPKCCTTEFGIKFALDDRLLYVGDTFAQETGPTSTTPRPAGTLTAFHPTSHGLLDSFENPRAATGDSTYHYGLAVELMSDDRVAATEYFLTPSDAKSRVHILDLRTLAPTFTPVESGTSGSSPPSPQATTTTPTPPPTPTLPIRPALTSTQYSSPDKVILTYDVTLDPFEVDIDDYVMTDVGLEIVSTSVDDRVVTLTYAGSPALGTPNATPSVELIGTIDYY